jgi:hypothetical protein
MSTLQYSYETCLDGSVKNAWTVDDCFQGRDFDFTKPFLPDRIAGVSGIGCLSDVEKRKLNQIRGNSYCHIFAFVEEYIVPMVVDHARGDVYGDETRLWSLLRFAEEEVKHQEMLRRACSQFEAGFGTSCGLVPGREQVASVVLGTPPLTALLLTSMIEWFTQLHYVEHVRDSAELDELFRDILRFHWIDESRHARLDSLLIEEVASDLGPEEREAAVDGLLELGSASTSTRCSSPPAVHSASPSEKRSASTSSGRIGGPSSSRASSTRTSSASSSSSRLAALRSWPKPRVRSPRDRVLDPRHSWIVGSEPAELPAAVSCRSSRHHAQPLAAAS